MGKVKMRKRNVRGDDSPLGSQRKRRLLFLVFLVLVLLLWLFGGSLLLFIGDRGLDFVECLWVGRTCSPKLERPNEVDQIFSPGKELTGIKNEELLRLEHNTPLSLHIYVYDEEEIIGLKELLAGRDHSIHPDSCLKGQWGTQVKIHNSFLSSSFRTKDKAKANFFFVPAYVKCMSVMGGLNEEEINQKYVQAIQQMPYFKLSGGRDHIFVFPSGNGAHFFRDWAFHIGRSIFLTPEGDITDKKSTTSFNTWKDIIIPGNIDNVKVKGSVVQGLIAPLPINRRKFLANYLGHAQGKVGRLKLVDLASKYPDEIEAPKLDRWGPNSFRREEYFLHLRNAKFCFAPRGESSWTLRFFEAFFVECVPVILSDKIELPFQNVLDYKQFSIKWPVTRIDKSLLDYLHSIPDVAMERLIARGREVRCLWVYAPESENCSAMTGILWELQRKVRLFQQSNEAFRLHDGSIVNEDLLPMKLWNEPVDLV